jgi:hypothetical protein
MLKVRAASMKRKHLFYYLFIGGWHPSKYVFGLRRESY